METPFSSSLFVPPQLSQTVLPGRFIFPYPKNNIVFRNKNTNLAGNRKIPARILAVKEIAAVADPAQAEITWQIIVGAFAGITPFVVAGIEFSKRIVAQKRCDVCGGSGLVLRNDYYVRCPGCGGFLPWQSWKRFFSG